MHPLQGDTDRLNYAAQQQAKQVGDAAIPSQEAQLLVLRQQKAYQQAIAPFDGVATRRNIDVGQPGPGRCQGASSTVT